MGEVITLRDAPGPSVLVVEDDPLLRHEIVRCLEDLGIETYDADNGRDALREIRIRHPAVVIMDIHLPDLDGITAAELLSEQSTWRPKILLVTGDPGSLHRANSSPLDVFGVIEKPVPLRTLSRFVAAALDDVRNPSE